MKKYRCFLDFIPEEEIAIIGEGSRCMDIRCTFDHAQCCYLCPFFDETDCLERVRFQVDLVRIQLRESQM